MSTTKASPDVTIQKRRPDGHWHDLASAVEADVSLHLGLRAMPGGHVAPERGVFRVLDSSTMETLAESPHCGECGAYDAADETYQGVPHDPKCSLAPGDKVLGDLHALAKSIDEEK